MKKQWKVAALLLVCVMLTGVLFGCASGEKQSAGSTGEGAAVVPDDPNQDWIPIETKFGTLYYPDQWAEWIDTEQSETDDAVKVLFRAKLGEQSFDLFELAVGAGEGERDGTLTGPDGAVRDVHVKLMELPELTGLTEGETNRVYAMQEAVNDVLDHLS